MEPEAARREASQRRARARATAVLAWLAGPVDARFATAALVALSLAALASHRLLGPAAGARSDGRLRRDRAVHPPGGGGKPAPGSRGRASTFTTRDRASSTRQPRSTSSLGADSAAMAWAALVLEPRGLRRPPARRQPARAGHGPAAGRSPGLPAAPGAGARLAVLVVEPERGPAAFRGRPPGRGPHRDRRGPRPRARRARRQPGDPEPHGLRSPRRARLRRGPRPGDLSAAAPGPRGADRDPRLRRPLASRGPGRAPAAVGAPPPGRARRRLRQHRPHPGGGGKEPAAQPVAGGRRGRGGRLLGLRHRPSRPGIRFTVARRRRAPGRGAGVGRPARGTTPGPCQTRSPW